MLRRIFFTGFILCAIASSVFGQLEEYNIQFFGIEEGLIDRNVYSINQDDQGFIWLGTGNGLVRFDGKNFKKVSDQNGKFITGFISKITKDKKGRFFIQQKDTEIIPFDPITEERIVFDDLPEEDVWKGATLMSTTKEGHTYFKTEKGAIYYLDNDDNFNYCFTDENLKDQTVKTSSWGTLLSLNREKNRLEERNKKGVLLRSKSTEKYITDFYTIDDNLSIHTFYKDDIDYVYDHSLYPVAHEDSLYVNLSIIKSSLARKVFSNLKDRRWIRISHCEYAAGNTCFVVEGNLFFFDKHNELVGFINENKLNKTRSEFPGINDLFFDKDNRLWLCTGIGVYLVQKKESNFQNYLSEEKGQSIRGIAELSEGKIIVNTYDGVKVIDGKSGLIYNQFDTHGLGVAVLNVDTIFIGTHGPCLGLLNLTDNKITRIKVVDDIDAHLYIPYYYKEDKVLYIGSNKGLYFKEDTAQLFKYFKSENDLPAFNYSSIYSFHKSGGKLWMATNTGLYSLENKTRTIRKTALPFDDIKHIHEDQKGDFWMATTGSGIIHWDRSANEKYLFTTKEGLSHDVTYAIYEDQNEFLWIPSNNGLMRFDKKTNEVIVFHEEDGIAHEEFNTFSHCQGSDGRLYFGGLNGVTSFYPDDLKPKENTSPFVITSYYKFDAEREGLVEETTALQKNKEIILNAGDKFFTLGFQLLDYFSGEHLYAWRIKGLDNEWNYQKENTVRINTLKFGKYTLEIKAKGEGGTWAFNQLTIPITVHKPFYLKWSFLIFCFLFTLFSGLFLINLRFRYLTKREEVLRETVAERTAELSQKNKELEELNKFKDKIYAIIAHDLRGPAYGLQSIAKKVNYLIETNQLERLKEYGNSVDESLSVMNNMLDNLLKWANQNLKRISIHPELQPIEPIVDQVLAETKLLAANKSIVIIKDIDKQLDFYIDKPTVTTILRNLIVNAIKFTPKEGQVSIRATAEDNVAKIEVIDNGVGIGAERISLIFDMNKNRSTTGTGGEKGTGLGLSLSKKLAKLNHGDLEVASDMNKGTTFSLVLPAEPYPQAV